VFDHYDRDAEMSLVLGLQMLGVSNGTVSVIDDRKQPLPPRLVPRHIFSKFVLNGGFTVVLSSELYL